MRYLFEPTSVAGGIAGGLVGPLVNFRAIQADYLNANARQLQAIYSYQRVIVNAFNEVITWLAKVQNYSTSIEIKRQQVERLEASVETANRLYQNAQTEYIDVLFAQRDLWDARAVLIETKQGNCLPSSTRIKLWAVAGIGRRPRCQCCPNSTFWRELHATPPPPPGDPANPNSPVIDPNAPPTVPAQPPDLPAALP